MVVWFCHQIDEWSNGWSSRRRRTREICVRPLHVFIRLCEEISSTQIYRARERVRNGPLGKNMYAMEIGGEETGAVQF